MEGERRPTAKCGLEEVNKVNLLARLIKSRFESQKRGPVQFSFTLCTERSYLSTFMCMYFKFLSLSPFSPSSFPVMFMNGAACVGGPVQKRGPAQFHFTLRSDCIYLSHPHIIHAFTCRSRS